MVFVILAFAWVFPFSPARAESVTLTPAPLTDDAVKEFLRSQLSWDPVVNLGETMAGSVAGGGAYSKDGDVITFLSDNLNYINAFPPLAMLASLADEFDVTGQFIGVLIAKSPYSSSLNNLMESGAAIYDWRLNGLFLRQITSVEPSTIPLTITLGAPLDRTLSFSIQYVFDMTQLSQETDLFIKTSFGAVLGIPLQLFADEPLGDEYWLFGLIGNVVSDAGIFGSHPFGDDDLAFFISASNGQGGLTVSAVPLTGAIWLFGTGLLGLAGLGRRFKGRS